VSDTTMLKKEQMLVTKKETRIARIILNYKKWFRGISKNSCNIFYTNSKA